MVSVSLTATTGVIVFKDAYSFYDLTAKASFNGSLMSSNEISTLRMALESVQYERMNKSLYRANWSSPEVKHYIRIQRWQNNVGMHFGLRNDQAETFSLRMINEFGGSLFASLDRKRKITDCTMDFSLDLIARTTPPFYLRVWQMTDEEVYAALVAAIKDALYPIIRNVTSVSDLYSFLLSDSAECGWIKTNPAIRASQIIWIGVKDIGVSTGDMAELMMSHEKVIKGGLGKEVRPAEFLKSVIGSAAEVHRAVP